MNIPAIPKVPQAIRDAASKGELVIFIGAGVSKIIGCPSWKEFALKYLDTLRDSGRINFFEYERLSEEDPKRLLTICQRIIKDEKLQTPDISRMFDGKPDKIKKHRIYENLYGFNAIYVTTNYDKHLDNVASKSRNRSKPVTSSGGDDSVQQDPDPGSALIVFKEEDLLISALDNGNVIHIHGSVDDPSQLVVTFSDYVTRYENGSRTSELLKEIFKTRTVLFVGYGLDEYEIIEFVIRKSEVDRGEVRHYMLFSAFKEEGKLTELLSNYYKELGVELVPYSKTRNGYDQLVKVLKSWAKEIGPTSRPLDFIEKRKLIEEVI